LSCTIKRDREYASSCEFRPSIRVFRNKSGAIRVNRAWPLNGLEALGFIDANFEELSVGLGCCLCSSWRRSRS
jgi:hypothetical protein